MLTVQSEIPLVKVRVLKSFQEIRRRSAVVPTAAGKEFQEGLVAQLQPETEIGGGSLARGAGKLISGTQSTASLPSRLTIRLTAAHLDRLRTAVDGRLSTN